MRPSAPMLLRANHRQKDGKRDTYCSLVETVRTADGPRQRTLCHLGELNDSAQARWLKTIDVFDDARRTAPAETVSLGHRRPLMTRRSHSSWSSSIPVAFQDTATLVIRFALETLKVHRLEARAVEGCADSDGRRARAARLVGPSIPGRPLTDNSPWRCRSASLRALTSQARGMPFSVIWRDIDPKAWPTIRRGEVLRTPR
jgi:hypothetical protein